MRNKEQEAARKRLHRHNKRLEAATTIAEQNAIQKEFDDKERIRAADEREFEELIEITELEGRLNLHSLQAQLDALTAQLSVVKAIIARTKEALKTEKDLDSADSNYEQMMRDLEQEEANE